MRTSVTMVLWEPPLVPDEPSASLRERRLNVVRRVLHDTLHVAMSEPSQTRDEWEAAELERWGKSCLRIVISERDLARCDPRAGAIQDLVVQRFLDAARVIAEPVNWPRWVGHLFGIVRKPRVMLSEDAEWLLFPVEPIIPVR